MLQSNNGLIFTARDLRVETRIYECVNTDLPDSLGRKEIMEANFSLLKQRGFSFDKATLDATGKYRGDNYGNYYLDLISIDDFIPLGSASFVNSIDEYYKTLFANNEISAREQTIYAKTVLNALKFFVHDC